jgi:hypothetical protein
MELQAEAVWAQWQHCTLLPSTGERLQAAMDEAHNERRVVDTHYLGDAQWDYCRDMARLAGLYYDDTTTASNCGDTTAEASIEAYIRMNKAIYDYIGRYRKSLLPGGPDSYRSLIITRYPSQDKFEVTTSMNSSSTLTGVDENNVDGETLSNFVASDTTTSSQQHSANRTIITI